MCGRTACTLDPDDVCRACSYKDHNEKWKLPKWNDCPRGNQYFPSYNVAPSSHTPVLFSNEETDLERIVQPMHWGLIPFWHKGSIRDVEFETNNARIETLLTKQIFKVPLSKGRRCVVLADGYYEWQSEENGPKQPYYIYFRQPDDIKVGDTSWKERGSKLWSETDGWGGPKLLTMAGVYDIWKDPNDECEFYSYAVVTMDSSPTMSFIHDRMPAILDGEKAVENWLDVQNVDLNDAVNSLVPVMSLVYHPVTKSVGNSRYKEADCILPIDLTVKKETNSKSSEFMANWLKKATPTKEMKSDKKDTKSKDEKSKDDEEKKSKKSKDDEDDDKKDKNSKDDEDEDKKGKRSKDGKDDEKKGKKSTEDEDNKGEKRRSSSTPEKPIKKEKK